jgi:hypothetical protein
MYHHEKKLMYTVDVGEADPKFGKMLLEQFGGANGELAAAMQYSIQGINCEDAARKDLLMDIGTEELSHFGSRGSIDKDASEADEKQPRSSGGRSSSGDRGRRRCCPFRFDGQRMNVNSLENHR